jgi:hypothetical protein
MIDSAAIIVAFLSLVSAAVFVFLGWRLSQRVVARSARLPLAQFATFWFGLALTTGFGGFESAWAVFGTPPLGVVVTILYLELLLISILLWGLLSYLVYIFTGRQYLVALSVLYAAVYVTLLYLIAAAEPQSVTVSLGTVGVTYESAIAGPAVLGVVALILLPEILASLAYFSLYFRTKDRTIRFRVTLVGWGLFLWFSSGLLGLGTTVDPGLAGIVLQHLIALAVAVLIFIAFFPPGLLRERYRISGVDERGEGAGL